MGCEKLSPNGISFLSRLNQASSPLRVEHGRERRGELFE